MLGRRWRKQNTSLLGLWVSSHWALYMCSEKRESRKLLVQILWCWWSVCYHCNHSLGRLSSKVERKNCALHLIQAKGNKRCKPLHGETMNCLLETPSFLKNRTEDANPVSCTWEIAKKFNVSGFNSFLPGSATAWRGTTTKASRASNTI